MNTKKENENRQSWGKKGEVVFTNSSINEKLLDKNKIEAEIIEDNSLLDERNIKISAEKEPTTIENIDDMNNIEEISDEIEKEVNEDNLNELEERRKIEENIEIIGDIKKI